MRVKLDHIEDVAANTKMFWFTPDQTVRYIAGQFVEVILPHDQPDSRGIRRWFTLSSSPTEKQLAITTKFSPEGSTFKKALLRSKPGERIMMSQPMGDFVLPKDKTLPLVFVAGGIGVTPVRSMLKWLADSGEKRNVRAIYAAHDNESVAFKELLERAAKVTYVLQNPPKGWRGESGRLDAAKLLALAPDTANQRYYMSGPEAMVEALYKGLRAAGIDERRLVGDYFPGY